MHILRVWFSLSTCVGEVISMTCGIDNAPRYVSYEGVHRMEFFPWLGILYYPRNNKRYTTAVVLVTRQLVLASALEIDKLPKHDFRARARVIVGKSCIDELGIGIRGYTYHPEYDKSTYSAIALVQLDVGRVKTDLRPICPPPISLDFLEDHFYAMVLSDDCKQSLVTIHKVLYIPPNECKMYYKEAGLGFGVHGPGCEAPSRFVDYSMYHEWVQHSVERIGRPAITRVAENYLVLRRSQSTLQRFGSCDEEEMQTMYFSELGNVKYETIMSFTAKYTFNLTIIDAVEYTCVTLRANYTQPSRWVKTEGNDSRPILWLRRWCGDSGSSNKGLCSSGSQLVEIKFYMEIEFNKSLEYEIKMFGKPVKLIDPSEAHKEANKEGKSPEILSYKKYREYFAQFMKDKHYPLLGKKKMKEKEIRTVTENEDNKKQQQQEQKEQQEPQEQQEQQEQKEQQEPQEQQEQQEQKEQQEQQEKQEHEQDIPVNQTRKDSALRWRGAAGAWVTHTSRARSPELTCCTRVYGATIIYFICQKYLRKFT